MSYIEVRSANTAAGSEFHSSSEISGLHSINEREALHMRIIINA